MDEHVDLYRLDPLAAAQQQQPADLIASDCPLAGLQLEQAGASVLVGGRTVRHPIQIVRDAYGLSSESGS